MGDKSIVKLLNHPLCKMCKNPVNWDSSHKRWRIYCSPLCARSDKASQREKQKATNLERYGVETSTKNKEVSAKQKVTNLEKYGYATFRSSPQGQEKAK